MPSHGVINASLAGVLAALAGITAKFALSSDSPQTLLQWGNYFISPAYSPWIVRGLFMLASLLFNSLMLTTTAKAMQLCSTTVQSVVTTSAVNFLVTGLLGTFLLGEYIGFVGMIGMIFIQIGILIISNEKTSTESSINMNEKNKTD